MRIDCRQSPGENCTNSVAEDFRDDFVNMRLMGLKSCIQVAMIFFGIRVMNVALRLPIQMKFMKKLTKSS